jgi:hypothetical protein
MKKQQGSLKGQYTAASISSHIPTAAFSALIEAA